MHKKAQQGASAAILVAIIAALIVVYVIFLPSVEREKLLEGEDANSKNDEADNLLLKEFIGQLSVGEDLENRKDLPNVFLFETTNAKELAHENPFVVSRGWFSNEDKTITFSLSDLENTENAILSFVAKKHKGVLTILLNGEILFESEITQENIQPIRIEKSKLKDQNTLQFLVSPVGLKFWSTNEYALESLKVSGDITDRSKQESQNIFTLSASEFSDLEKAELRFVPYCKDEARVGSLEILVNNRNIFSAVPVCEDPYKQIIPSGVLEEGQNKVVFKTTKGSYSVEQIHIETEYKKTKSRTYFFELNQSRFDQIIADNDEVVLTLEFTDDDEDKRGVLDINGRLRSFDQDEKTYSATINGLIENGNNYVRIEPETELNIIELRVEVEEK